MERKHYTPQPAVLVGTATLSTTPASCYTSTAGNIVGVPDPLVLPGVITNTASGTLAAGTYFTKLTYTGAGGESVASPETTTVLSAQGTLIIAAPILHLTRGRVFRRTAYSGPSWHTKQKTIKRNNSIAS